MSDREQARAVILDDVHEGNDAVESIEYKISQSNKKPLNRAPFSPTLFVGEKVPKADEGVFSIAKMRFFYFLMNVGETSVELIGNTPPSAFGTFSPAEKRGGEGRSMFDLCVIA